jgi:hypothetical protein
LIRSVLMLVLLLWAAPVGAQEASSSHAVDQAKLFMRKGWHADARDELLLALTSPEGSQNFEVHWLLALVLYELLVVGRATEHARVAAGLTEDPDQQATCWQLVDFYESTFGAVEVIGPKKGIASRLQLELTSTLFDPELKRFVARKTLDLTDTLELPATVWLPAGSYLINGHEVTVRAGDTVRLQLPLDALGARGMASLQVMRVELGGGFGVLLGSRVANLHPSIESHISFTLPIKGLLLGATIDKSFRSFEVDGYDPSPSPAAFGGGLRLGTDVLVGGPLAFRPFVSYRYGLLPGIGFDCHETREGLSCAAELDESGVTDRFYGTAKAHTVGAELGIDYREGGRTNALGLGVRVGVDQTFGAVSSASRAAYDGADNTVEVVVEDGSFHATGVRLLANLSIAL